ncbi:YibE/F family protein [Mycobacteroides abscessus]|nr:YibE/F family protein [Mycobacteroides abscessus]
MDREREHSGRPGGVATLTLTVVSHSHTHSHAHHGLGPKGTAPFGSTAARIVVGLLAAMGIAVLVGLVALWPEHRTVDIPLPYQNAHGGAVTTESGTVLATRLGECGSPSTGQVLTADPAAGQTPDSACALDLIAITSGPNSGAKTQLEFTAGGGQPTLAAGEHIRITRQVDAQGATSYSFYDYERTWPLIAVAAAFAIVICLVARWRGLRALVGILVAFLVLAVFLLPALRDGGPALPLALIASAAILFVVIYLAHGVSMRTSAALLGTLTAMLLAAGLSGDRIVLATAGGRDHYLAAVYDVGLCETIDELTTAGERRLGVLVERLGAQRISISEPKWIVNVNTAADLAALPPLP